MPSFLDKINNQASEGNIVKPSADGRKAAPADTSALGHLASAAMPGQGNPQPKAAKQPQPASQAEPTAQPAAQPAASRPVFAPAPTQHEGGIRTTEHEVEIDKGYGRRRFIQIVSAILAILILVAGIVVAVRYFTMVELPDFTGKTIAEMKKWCIDNKIYITESPVYRMDVDENYIISQSIEGGTRIAPKKTVNVVYSLGADPNEKIPVPDLMSMTAPEISEWGQKNKLAKLKINEEYSNDYEKGAVIRYTFSSATVSELNFTRGDSLTVTVSRGPSEYNSYRQIKNYRGALRSEAENWCNNYGIKAVFTEEPSDEIAEGRIISQSVEPGKTLEYGDTVEFIVSSGPGIIVPDFSNTIKEEASGIASGLNVVVKSQYSSTVPYGGFISQSVEAGSRVFKKDAVVVVTYSLGKPYISNLVGMREDSIPQMFYDLNRNGAGLTYNIVYVDSKVAKGTVVAASRGSEWVELHSFIEIEVSRGNLKDDDTKPVDPITYYYVPDYSKILKEDAAAYNRNINVEIVTRYSETVPYGGLISQSVSAGTPVTANNKVTLIYSAGKPYIGKVSGMNESQLPEFFYMFTRMGANVTYQISYVDSTEPRGTVISASKENEYIGMTEVIQIQVSKG